MHEHLHAALAAGLDTNGQVAAARNTTAWRDAANLNESLAAWAALDFSRDDPDMLNACWDYIRRDDYPQWPYRGAERIESLVRDHGLVALWSLVQLFRDDPEVAQHRFDTREQSGRIDQQAS